MSLRDTLFGHAPDRKPYSTQVEYVDGSVGHLPVWATNVREALVLVWSLLPEHKEIVRLTVFLRLEQEQEIDTRKAEPC